MLQTEIQALYQRFLTLCDAYQANPDILTALALEEVVCQLNHACVGRQGDQVMHDQLQRLLHAIPGRDMAEFHRLLDAIRTTAENHDLA